MRGAAERSGLDAIADEERRVLAAITQSGADGVQRGAILRVTNLSKHVFPRPLARLLDQKRITSVGKGSATRYFASGITPPPMTAKANGHRREPQPPKPKAKPEAATDEATRRVYAAITHAGDTGVRCGSIPHLAAVTEHRAHERVQHLVTIGAVRMKAVAGAKMLYATGKPATAPPPPRQLATQTEPPLPAEPLADLGRAEAKWSAALHGEQSAAFARPEVQQRLAAAAKA